MNAPAPRFVIAPEDAFAQHVGAIRRLSAELAPHVAALNAAAEEGLAILPGYDFDADFVEALAALPTGRPMWAAWDAMLADARHSERTPSEHADLVGDCMTEAEDAARDRIAEIANAATPANA